MAVLDLKRKLAILSDAAKYDASCASSGAVKRDSIGRQGRRLHRGHGHLPRLCAGRPLHQPAEDPADQLLHLRLRLLHEPRVVEHARARFTVKEVVDLTLNFYKRNYIEGLFLSSGIIRTATTPWRRWSGWRKSLRLDHDFRGYIHLKVIPEASPELANEAGLYADRVSINIELPATTAWRCLAPEKDAAGIKKAMGARAPGHRRRQGEGPQEGAEVRPVRPVDPDDRRRRRRQGRRHPGKRARRSTAPITCGGSTIRPSARSPTPPAACRWPGRRWCASTASTRPTG
jgi:hypothetical protein